MFLELININASPMSHALMAHLQPWKIPSSLAFRGYEVQPNPGFRKASAPTLPFTHRW